MTRAKAVRRPRREQPGEVERLAHLVGADERGPSTRGSGSTPRRRSSGRPGSPRAPGASAGRRRAPRAGPTSARRAGALDHGVRAGSRSTPLPGSSPSATTWSRRPASLSRPCATSTRKPSTPRSSQNRRTVLEHVADLGVAPVEVGLGGVEEVQVPLAVRHPGPRRRRRRPNASCSAAPRRSARGRRGTGSAPAPGCPGALASAAWNQACSLEVWLGTRSTITRSPSSWARGDQRVGVGQGAEQRVDVRVVRDVVAVVVLRRGVERRDPERVDPEVAQVGQPRRDPGQVADAVAVAVGEAADVDLVGDRVPPPGCRRLGAVN